MDRRPFIKHGASARSIMPSVLALGVIEVERVFKDIPTMPKRYVEQPHGFQPHQSTREINRRKKQMRKAARKQDDANLKALKERT